MYLLNETLDDKHAFVYLFIYLVCFLIKMKERNLENIFLLSNLLRKKIRYQL